MIRDAIGIVPYLLVLYFGASSLYTYICVFIAIAPFA